MTLSAEKLKKVMEAVFGAVHAVVDEVKNETMSTLQLAASSDAGQVTAPVESASVGDAPLASEAASASGGEATTQVGASAPEGAPAGERLAPAPAAPTPEAPKPEAPKPIETFTIRVKSGKQLPPLAEGATYERNTEAVGKITLAAMPMGPDDSQEVSDVLALADAMSGENAGEDHADLLTDPDNQIPSELDDIFLVCAGTVISNTAGRSVPGVKKEGGRCQRFWADLGKPWSKKGNMILKVV